MEPIDHRHERHSRADAKRRDPDRQKIHASPPSRVQNVRLGLDPIVRPSNSIISLSRLKPQ